MPCTRYVRTLFFYRAPYSSYWNKKIIVIGILLLFLSATINLLGSQFYHYLLSGIFVGVAWNFILISTTQLLPLGYEDHERAKVQGMTDFLIYSFGALGSLAAGVLFFSLGWQLMNVLSMVISIFILVFCIVLKKHITQ